MSKPWVRQPCGCFAQLERNGLTIVSQKASCTEHTLHQVIGKPPQLFGKPKPAPEQERST